MAIDIVTVIHNEANALLAESLYESLLKHEDPDRFTFTIHDNRVENVGFAKGCNIGASKGRSDIIGFLNPDTEVHGPFIDKVEYMLSFEAIPVTGCRFNKPDSHLKEWGVRDWVCGAAFFTRRRHFELLGGFDEGFVWSFEETDFIRRTEGLGLRVVPTKLPLAHSSPLDDSPEDTAYKEKYFALAKQRYKEKWGDG